MGECWSGGEVGECLDECGGKGGVMVVVGGCGYGNCFFYDVMYLGLFV